MNPGRWAICAGGLVVIMVLTITTFTQRLDSNPDSPRPIPKCEVSPLSRETTTYEKDITQGRLTGCIQKGLDNGASSS